MRSFFKQYIEKGPNNENDQGIKQDSISYQILSKKSLPTISQINVKLINACNTHEEGIQEVSEIIRLDPALTYRMICMVHSAGYQIRKPAINLEGFVATIGIDVIGNLVFHTSTKAVFESHEGGDFFNLMMFWEHSLKCALLARLIAKEIHYAYPEEAYYTGLLHDLGKLVLWENFQDKYKDLLSAHHDPAELILLEDKTFGMNHSTAAAWLMDQLDFPSFATDAIFYHHFPMESIADASPLVKIVYVANILAKKNTQDSEQNYQTADKLLGLNQTQTNTCITGSDNRLEETKRFLGIDMESAENSGGNLFLRPGVSSTLLDEVRDASLIAGGLQNTYKAETRKALLKAIKESLQIMIGPAPIILFLYNSDRDALEGHYAEDNDNSLLFENLSIPGNSKKSMVISSFLDKTPVDSFRGSGHSERTILESQIIHFMGKEGILCLPMPGKEGSVGVIVIGIDRVEIPFFSEQERLLGVFARRVSAIVDADEKKRNRIHQVHSDRLGFSALRTRKIVHEINNPLSIIKNYLKVLGMRLTEKKIEHDEIMIVNEEINRIRDMLSTLAGPAVKDSQRKKPVNINSLISDLILLTNRSLTKQSGIKIHLDADPSIPAAEIQGDSLKQIFLNLMKNAIEAMPEGGNIFIKTLYVPGTVGGRSNLDGSGSRGILEISIHDDGPGIPEEFRKGLFDPFVTSREGHDGLGLSIVSDLINQMDGSIIYEDDQGKGTTFKIRLPWMVQ